MGGMLGIWIGLIWGLCMGLTKGLSIAGMSRVLSQICLWMAGVVYRPQALRELSSIIVESVTIFRHPTTLDTYLLLLHFKFFIN
jgi:hypothetical protein